VQPAGLLNYPDQRAYTRSAEYHHFYRRHSDWTTLGRDYPCWNDAEPCYRVPNPANRALYARYKALAATETDTLFCGRLGTYKYYNMDQCIAQALTLAERLLRGG
jgi:UDP-galactopyranose mutase